MELILKAPFPMLVPFVVRLRRIASAELIPDFLAMGEPNEGKRQDYFRTPLSFKIRLFSKCAACNRPYFGRNESTGQNQGQYPK
jgi:hypothetical protein